MNQNRINVSVAKQHTNMLILKKTM